jgi:hypothetical protein
MMNGRGRDKAGTDADAQRETVAIVLKFLAQRCASASTEA